MTHKNPPAEDSPLVYQSRLPLSTKTLTTVTTAIRRHRAQVRSRWRKLPDHSAAAIVLAVLRHDQRPVDLAAANGISANTVRRWVNQVITTLAAQMPRLSRILRRARHHTQVVLLDGTLIPVQRPRDRRRRHAHYNGKHKTFGLTVLAITDLTGNLLWISAAYPGRTAEITAARRHRIPAHLRHHDLAAICDLGFTNLDDQPGPYPGLRPRRQPPGRPDDHPTIITGRRPARAHPLTRYQHAVNNLIAGERATNEHGFADLKNWRILHQLRGNHRHATTLLRALTVLTQSHITR
ncbi:transposase [Verrucosispora sp. WMMA2121]|uniref:transposase family protein n=1 Tax=Verrucosispora sp. WMMA2121 TaxID=3015164 RepID=UPI0022B754F0|nr:transposase family protein [Verrucosispora sp. WMMA2121]MCZ7420269.1 transposase [Verrucosispora sp. WMMA2121]